MSLFFITGSAGSGKTTTVQEIGSRGYEIYDVDLDGFAKWQHNDTGFIHPKSSVSEDQRTPDFLSKHSWNFPRSEAEELAAQAADRHIFVSGSLDNAEDLNDLFAAGFALYVNEDELTHRLATRTSGDWGKQPHELQITLEQHSKIYDTYKQLGYLTIDSSQPLERVADIILSNSVLKS